MKDFLIYMIICMSVMFFVMYMGYKNKIQEPIYNTEQEECIANYKNWSQLYMPGRCLKYFINQ